MPIITVQDSAHFQSALGEAGAKLVVIDFTAKWCGPCRLIAPEFERLSNKFLHVVFLKVDIDDCDSIASQFGITSIPTFVFMRSKSKLLQLGSVMGRVLEEKINELAGNSVDGEGGSGTSGSGPSQYGVHNDLTPLINKSGCECLNESDEYEFSNCLESHKGTYLESDCDEQLIITLAFSQPIKLHSLKIKADKEYGPKTIKIFVNQTKSLDFDQADSCEPVQVLELKQEDLDDKASPVELKYVRFQNVNSFTIFVKDNQTGKETTRISQIIPIGSAVASTNMSEFKRIGGKAGQQS